MRDPILTTRRELAIRTAVRGTDKELARAVQVLDETGGVDTIPAHPCRHAITTVSEDLHIECLVCKAVL